jgi:SEC-C motif-containing protein
VPGPPPTARFGATLAHGTAADIGQMTYPQRQATTMCGMDRLMCPCGLGDEYGSCCGRLHAGAPAPTAESLMRSRYSAFAVGDAGYLLRTWHPSGRPAALELEPGLRWTRLAVLEADGGGLFDATGTVRFRAIYVQDGKRGVLAETSRFIRQDGLWSYLGPVD